VIKSLGPEKLIWQ